MASLERIVVSPGVAPEKTLPKNILQEANRSCTLEVFLQKVSLQMLLLNVPRVNVRVWTFAECFAGLCLFDVCIYRQGSACQKRISLFRVPKTEAVPFIWGCKRESRLRFCLRPINPQIFDRPRCIRSHIAHGSLKIGDLWALSVCYLLLEMPRVFDNSPVKRFPFALWRFDITLRRVCSISSCCI